MVAMASGNAPGETHPAEVIAAAAAKTEAEPAVRVAEAPPALNGSNLGIAFLTPLVWWLRNVPVEPALLVGIVDKESGLPVSKSMLGPFLPFLEQTTVHLSLFLHDGRECTGQTLAGPTRASLMTGVAAFPGLIIKQASPYTRCFQLKATAVGPRNLKFSIRSQPLVIYAPALSQNGLVANTGAMNLVHRCPMCGAYEKPEDKWGMQPRQALRFCHSCADKFLSNKYMLKIEENSILLERSRANSTALNNVVGGPEMQSSGPKTPNLEVPAELATLLVQYHQLKQAYANRGSSTNDDYINHKKRKLEEQIGAVLSSHGLSFGDLARMRPDFTKRYGLSSGQPTDAPLPEANGSKKVDTGVSGPTGIQKRTKPNSSPLTRRTHAELTRLFARHTIYLLAKATELPETV